MRRLIKTKMLKLAKLSSLGVAPLVGLSLSTIVLASCSPTNPEAKTIGLIDGTDWSGRNAGSFISDDYSIDYVNQVVTYKSAISIHSYNLVIPNYVVLEEGDDILYRVDIGPRCFANNSGIAGTVEFNDFISTIPQSCFFNCTSLTGLVFHTYPISFDVGAFSNCFLLSQIFILHDGVIYRDWASQVISIGDYAFFNSMLTGEIKFGPALQYLGQSAFENCTGITVVDFSMCQNLTYINVSAFGSCTLLQEVYLSNSISIIQEKAFRDCGLLQFIHIPEEHMPISIGTNAFYNCSFFENFSKTPFITNIEPGAFALDQNIKIWAWEPKYNLEELPPYTYSSCNFSALKFWKDGPNIQDYAFANNNSLSVLDFTDFVITESDDPTQIGKVIVPDWEGEHIFSSSNPQGGTIYLPSNGVLDNGWIQFFAKNDIEVSSQPTQEGEPHWRVVYGAPRIDFITESEQKTAQADIKSGPVAHVSFEGFTYSTIGEVQQEDIEKNLRVFYFPKKQSDKTPYPVQTTIVHKGAGKFDLKIDIDVSSLSASETIVGKFRFFYKNNQVASLNSNYTIELKYN